MAVVLVRISKLEESVIDKPCYFLDARLAEEFKPVGFDNFVDTGDMKMH